MLLTFLVLSFPKAVNRESKTNMRRRHHYRFMDSGRLSAGVLLDSRFRGKDGNGNDSQKQKRALTVVIINPSFSNDYFDQPFS